MKRIKLIYVLLLAITMPLLTACSSEDTLGNSDPTNQKGEKITVRFRVSQAAPATTRAWQDAQNATNDEMMNVWVVVGVNNSTDADKKDKVVGIWACKPSGEPDQEVDKILEIKAALEENTSYRFYSFANMTPAKVMALLGIGSGTPPTSSDGTEETISASDFMTNSVGTNEVKQIAFADATVTAAAVEGISVKVEGNGFDPTASDNGFSMDGETVKGIPMSNVQTFDNLTTGTIQDLIVIRMLAKIKIQLYNDCGTDITINSITLTDLTANEGNNLKLLPKPKTGANTMESNDGFHADIEPNLNGTPTQEKYIYEPATENKVVGEGVTLAMKNPVEYTFYVNESKNPKGSNKDITTPSPSSPQDFYRYFLTINLTKTVVVPGESGGASTTEEVKEVRYTLIDNNKNDQDEWNYIARNDYRIIPIVLDDYEFKIIPYDFPAIGVLPASVKEEDGVYTINFHDYGHFHLLPQVTRYSKPEDVIPYGNSGDVYWNLGEADDFKSHLLSTTTGVWGSWTDATKDTEYDNEAADFNTKFGSIYGTIPFYKPGYYNPSTTIEDGDEVGGEPVWYVNNSPEWVEEEQGQPFIFGFIADPNPDNASDYVLSTDRKVYHEFTINLHKNGSAPRPMTYRLYMILDQDQMLYRSRSLAAPAPRCSHHWHTH